MNIKKRFIRSVISSASTQEVELPWARGARRQAFIAKRQAQARLLKRSA